MRDIFSCQRSAAMKILELKLPVNNLDAQRSFYESKLGLLVDQPSRDELVVQAGYSRLVFEKAPIGWQGSYHFAFNIPENQLDVAKAWVSERVPLLKSADGADSFHSEGWNSDGIYFCDPAGNILELIARHMLDNAQHGDFSDRNILSVSEIGLAAENVPALVAQVCEKLGLTVYDGAGSDTFSAAGDENGLFVVVRQGRKWYPNLVVPAEFLPLQAKVEVGGKNFALVDSGNHPVLEPE
jgi:catechol-2,3-dioxygenase